MSETVERVRVMDADSAVMAEDLLTQVLLSGQDPAAMAGAAGFVAGAVWREDFTRLSDEALGTAIGNVWDLLRR